MVTFAESGQDWKDFPKGLSVLVVDEDRIFLDGIKAKLQSYQYMVTAFSEGDQALSALADKQFLFHVALVEAASTDIVDGYKILEASKGVPTIMMSNMTNMAIMMKCFALGAVEFLQKPLSDEKLRNIWQHVVRKAFSAGDSLLPESLKPVKDTIECMLKVCPLQRPNTSKGPSEEAEDDTKEESGSGSIILIKSGLLKEVTAYERFSAPSTPQLEQAGRMPSQEETLDESPRSIKSLESKTEQEDIVDKVPTHSSTVKIKNEPADVLHVDDMKLGEIPQDSMRTMKTYFCTKFELENGDCCKVDLDYDVYTIPSGDGIVTADGEKHGVEMGPSILATVDSCATSDLGAESSECVECHDSGSGDDEAVLQTDFLKTEEEIAAVQQSEGGEESKDDKRVKTNYSESGSKGSKHATGKKKMKVDWTPDLHRRFVQAVELIGVDQAIPSRILEVMKVEGLTRHNIASHLQKYRSHKRHLLSRELEAASWHPNRPLNRNGWVTHRQDGNAWFTSHQSKTRIQPRPQILPSIQLHPPPHGQPIVPPLHVWGHPAVKHSHMHMWQQPTVAATNTPNTWQAPDGSVWQHPATCADAWGHPTPFPGTPCYPQSTLKFFEGPVPGSTHTVPSAFSGEGPMHSNGAGDPDIGVASGAALCGKLFDFYPPKELLDAAISEALSNPCTPFPLGLKSPSIESVMAELQRQGINTIPPRAPP